MNPYLVFLLVLLTAVYLIETIADLLNLQKLKDGLPAEFQNKYDPIQYEKSLLYQRESTCFEIFHNTVSLFLVVAFTLWGGFNEVDLRVRSWNWGPIPTGLAFVGILSLLRSLVELPFSLYGTFVLEEKYGFNRTTFKTFLADLVKGTILGAILGGLIFSGLLLLFEVAGDKAWLYSWIGVTGIQLLLSYLAPVLLLPLFNRFTPLPSGSLREAIETYAKTRHFHLKEIFVMDSSRRSSKSNAFFTGFGRYRKLVLFDTLIKEQTEPELVAVLAHEIGHFEKKHIVKSILTSIFSTGIMFYILGQFMNNPRIFEAFKMDHISIYASVVFILFLYSPLSRLLLILTNAISRRHEYEADRFAAETFKQPEALISALKKLSMNHFSHLTPHPLKVLLDYSHPPILARIRALREYSSVGKPT